MLWPQLSPCGIPLPVVLYSASPQLQNMPSSPHMERPFFEQYLLQLRSGPGGRCLSQLPPSHSPLPPPEGAP